MRTISVMLMLAGTFGVASAQSAADDLVTKAVLKFEAGEYDDCEADLQKALDNEADLTAKSKAQAHLYKGRLYLRRQMEAADHGDAESLRDASLQAFREYQTALEVDDGTVKPVIDAQLNQLFPILFNTAAGEYNTARQVSESEALEHLARADEYAKAAYEIRPTNYKISDLRGRILYNLKDFKESLSAYLIARRFLPRGRATEPDFRGITNIFMSATIILRDHISPPNYTEALRLAQEGQQRLESEYRRWKSDFSSGDPSLEETYRNGRKGLLGEELRTYLARGTGLTDAIPAFESALTAEFKDDAAMHIQYGRLIQNENWVKAADHYALAAQIDPENQVAHYNRSVLFLNSAISLFNATLNSERTEDQEQDLQDYLNNARTSAETAHAIAPEDVGPLQILKQVADIAKDTEASERYAEMIRKLGGN